ncbi:MAG: hypothetical protein JNM77_12625 [Pseudonocardia sp.]|nr:hypothetical protein [Pseudonocardia sp.]
MITATSTRTDARRIQQAAAAEWADEFGPRRLLDFRFPMPDGGIRTLWGWTAGGEPLGDRIDADVIGRLDAADWLAALGRSHVDTQERGRNTVLVYDLAVVADLVKADRIPTPWSDDDQCRRGLAEFGHGLGAWVGVGPRLLARR